MSFHRGTAHTWGGITQCPRKKLHSGETPFPLPEALRTLKTVTSEPPVSTEVQSLIGLNTNLTVGGQLLHVQTEDLGRQRATIVTHVFANGGQVIQKVRFDYSQHLGHPNLAGILPRAMRAQHTAIMQRLRKEGASPAADLSQTDLPCAPEPVPTPSPEETPQPPSKQRPRLNPGTWDRLVAKAKAERDREREAAPAVPLPEASSESHELKPPNEKHDPARACQWDAAVASARREFDHTPTPDPMPAAVSELEARRAYDKAQEQEQLGDRETALVLMCKAVSLDVRNPSYRERLSRLLTQMATE